MEKGKKTTLTNDSTTSAANILTDLSAAGEQTEETKGGAATGTSSASINALLGDASVRRVR